ncbi:MAG TPA: hypothetical protein PLY93_10155 [Turneriella sp.]|nr:hypothetical protein [Turneriella sp.]
MKKLLLLILSASFAPSFAYVSSNVAGQTGLIATPTARINWENSGRDFGVTTGYTYFNNNATYNVPQVNLSLFRRWEIGGAYNAAPGKDNNDALLHTKLRFSPWSGTGASELAIGGSYQSLNSNPGTTAGQVYLAATYQASLFGMEADTTLVVGKTFGKSIPSGDVDFSMGFDLDFFPSLFKGYVRWLNELANYDYLYANAPTRALSRGAFNTGFRIPVLKHMSNLKFDVTIKMTDALDNERGFGIGAVVGGSF